MKYMREIHKENGKDKKHVGLLREYLLKYGESIVPEVFDGADRIWGDGWKKVIGRKGYQRPKRRNNSEKTIKEVNYLVNSAKTLNLKPSKNKKLENGNLKDIDHVILFESCCGKSLYPGVGESSKYVLDKIGISYETLKEQSCCGGFAYYGNDLNLEEMALIGARNQGLIESRGDVVAAVCPSCFSSNLEIKALLSSKENKKQINDILSGIGKKVDGNLHITHFQLVLYDNIDSIKDSIELDLTGLRVATHSGCHYRNFSSRPEKYRILDEIVKATGAEVVDYPLKNRCCGGGFEKSFVGEIWKVREINFRKQKSILDADVDLVVVNCPGCEMTFDRNSIELSRILPGLNLAYMHISEFLALAMGANPYEVVGIQYHTAYEPLLEELGMVHEAL